MGIASAFGWVAVLSIAWLWGWHCLGAAAKTAALRADDQAGVRFQRQEDSPNLYVRVDVTTTAPQAFTHLSIHSE